MTIQSSNFAQSVPNVCGICSLSHYTGLCNALSDKIVSHLVIKSSLIPVLIHFFSPFQKKNCNKLDTRQATYRQFVAIFCA